MTVTIGDRRIIFQIPCWWLPDVKLVNAGCFPIRIDGRAASASHQQTIQLCPTKHLSKHSLLKQRRAGYRPSALTKIVNDSGRTGGAVLKTNPLRRRGERLIAHDAWRQKKSATRPPSDRRDRRPKGEREAIGDRPATRLGTAEKPATLHGQSVAGYRRDRRGFQRARHSYLVTSASRNPRLSRLRLSSSPRRSPAPLRPHGLCDRGAERHHGQKPRTSAFRLSTHCAFVPKARGYWATLAGSGRFRPKRYVKRGLLRRMGATAAAAQQLSFNSKVAINSVIFRQALAPSGRLVLRK